MTDPSIDERLSQARSGDAAPTRRVIRLMIVDDHAVVRAGLHRLLEQTTDISVVAEAVDGADALVRMQEQVPEVVLMDLSMPGIDGIEATRRIVAGWPATRVVALTSFSDRERVLGMLDAGAAGYVLKDSSPDELVRAVRAAADGGVPLAPVAAATLMNTRAERTAADTLTARERDVLGLLAQGLQNRGIAERLGISEATVKAHLTHIYQALDVSDRTSAALMAHGLGLSAAYHAPPASR
jgi:DNA-binding NarL/FixJ family response regulator